MLTFQLGYDDFQRIARLCQSIKVKQLPRDFNFKDYLVQLLRHTAPLAAQRLRQLSSGEVNSLREEIVELQDLVS